MRWTKIVRDASQSRGSIVAMAAAMTVGIAAVAALSTAYGIIGREINQGYLATRPATAEMQVDHLEESDLAAVRSHEGVEWAEAGGREQLRVRVGPDAWLPLLLFVVADFDHQHMSVLSLDSGRWPTAAVEIVIERTAMPLANAVLGGQIAVQTAEGRTGSLAIRGVVHDPSLAPASQQQTVYGYATPATLRSLRLMAEPHLLKIVLAHPDASPESTILNIAGELIHAGHRLGEVRIPPRQHPHWGLMVNVINMLLSFSVLTFLLSSVLTATLTANYLAPQVRQIGVMKAIGARDGQIIAMLAGLVGVIGVVAVAIGVPLGGAAGRMLARYVGHTLNFDLRSVSIPAWIIVVEALAGVGIPLSIALWPIVRAARRPVREALDDHGVAQRTFARSISPAWQVMPGAPAIHLVLRNALRRRSRLLLTLTLLAMAGALFITSSNLSGAWQREVEAAVAERHYDLEIAFADPKATAAALGIAAAVPGVRDVEEYSDEPVSIARADGINLTHTFPDGGHGSLRLDQVRPDGAFTTSPMTQGRWLRPSDADGPEPGVVLNTAALSGFPGLDLGGQIQILVRGRVVRLTMRGLVDEHLAPAILYVASNAEALSESGITHGLRVSLERGDERFALDAAAALERALDAAGLRVAGSASKAQIGREYGGHLYIVIFTLGVMTALMAVVGVLGLGSAMATSVFERTREFGVMRAIGASRRRILSSVIAEGVCVGASSVALGAVLAIPATLLVAPTVGLSALGVWHCIGLSAGAIPLWLAIVLTSGAVASAYPAHLAARLTVGVALAYQ